MPYEFLKGHGTENDFVLLPDLDGTVHGELSPDGRGSARSATGGPASAATACSAWSGHAVPTAIPTAEWFMDYRNSDGSLSEMCGNGIRLFVRYLVDAGPGRRLRADPGRHPRRGQGADRRRRPDHRRHGHAEGARRDHGRASAASPGRPATSTWATRTPSRSSPPSTRPARCSSRPTHDPAVYPDGRQRRVRRTPRRAARRDARPRARLGRDPLLRHRRLRGDGRRRRGRRRPSGGLGRRLPRRRAGRHAHRHLDRRRPGAAHRSGGRRGAGETDL